MSLLLLFHGASGAPPVVPTGIPPLGCAPFEMDLAPPQTVFNLANIAMALDLLPDSVLFNLAPLPMDFNLAPPEMDLRCDDALS